MRSLRLRRRLFRPAPLLGALLIALALPSAAAATINLKIVNQSDKSPSEVFVTVAAPVGEPFDVTKVENNVPKPLDQISGEELEITEIGSGRVYIGYGAGVTEATTVSSPTRFDWAELNVAPSDTTDVANLTAVDQFGIGMRLDTFNAADEHLETVGAANSDTIFNALQGIPGGPQATIKNGAEFIRVISPNKSSVYPPLTEYVKSMAGQTITLHTAFFGTPFTTSVYSGTFAADGSITLQGTTIPGGGTSPITIPGAELIADIYTGGNTPNTLEGALKRDVLSGFSTGLWGGKYGNNAIDFCSNPNTTPEGTWCPDGFNQPSFGDARTSLSPFPTCEQYAAVINQYSDVYGNPYSDASKKVTVSLNQTSGPEVKTLQLTILPDSGTATPANPGNPNCGAAPPSRPVPTSKKAKSPVRFHLLRKAKVRKGVAKIGRINCPAACGRVKLVAKKGKKVVARGKSKFAKPHGPLKLKLTKPGKRMLARQHKLKVAINVWVTSPGQKTAHRHGSIKLIR